MRGYYIGWKHFYERFRGIEEALWATARFLISSVAWKSLSFFLFRSKHNRYDSKISENIRLYVEILTRITLNSLHLRDSLNSRWTSLNRSLYLASEIEVIYIFNEIIPITNYFPSHKEINWKRSHAFHAWPTNFLRARRTNERTSAYVGCHASTTKSDQGTSFL